jgi:iron complex outermembrane receptor protein
MKFFLLPLICIISFSIINAQTKVKGTIKDNAGQPIPSGSIIKGTTFGGPSDFDGNYNFTTSSIGEQTVKLFFINFKTYEKKIKLNSTSINVNVVFRDGGAQLMEMIWL